MVDHERCELIIFARREKEMARRGICSHYSYRQATVGAVCNLCDKAFSDVFLLLDDRIKQKKQFGF